MTRRRTEQQIGPGEPWCASAEALLLMVNDDARCACGVGALARCRRVHPRASFRRTQGLRERNSNDSVMSCARDRASMTASGSKPLRRVSTAQSAPKASPLDARNVATQ